MVKFDSISSGFSTDFNNDSSTSNTDESIDKELQEFILIEKQKAEISAQIHEFNDLCWEKCFVDKPSKKLGGKTETCLSNCVNRFIDVSLFIANRFTRSLQKSSNMLN